jgi:hypothetical protein
VKFDLVIAVVCCLTFGFGFAGLNAHYGWGIPWYARFALNMMVYYVALMTARSCHKSDGVH